MRDNYDGRIYDEVVAKFADYYNNRIKDKIATAAIEHEQSITIDLHELYRFDSDLAEDVVDNPVLMHAHAKEALGEVMLPDPDTEEQVPQLDVRISNVGWEINVSALREEHEGKLLGLRGQVSQATQVQPKLTEAVFRCERCSTPENDVLSDPIPQFGEELALPEQCFSCERSGPWSLSEESTKEDHQIVELRDEPGETIGAGQNKVPVHLYGDLAGTVNAGDTVRVNGHIKTQRKLISGTQKESTRQPWKVNASSVDAKELAFNETTPERVDEIKELSEKEDLEQLFIDSFAPNILTSESGDKHKLGAIMSMFGGVQKNGKRGDINIIYVGEPGTGKSQYLRRARIIAPLAVEASGKGATAAGLTATARPSDYDEGWMLDAGALVMGSGGIACIDEFDKMGDDVRKSMHEAMENQRVPITKAGINTTLKTETSVIAAANPIGGVFDRYTPMQEQINLGPTLLSRFDLKFGLMDNGDEQMDEDIALHQHSDAEGGETEQPLEDELMSQYIAYARQNFDPTYENPSVKQRLVDYYVNIRQKARENDNQPPTPRMNDSMRRLAQASARMRLSETIEHEDADRVIALMNQTIGETALDEEGNENFGDEVKTPTSYKERVKAIVDVTTGQTLSRDEIVVNSPVKEEYIDDSIEKALRKGAIYEPETGKYRAT